MVGSALVWYTVDSWKKGAWYSVTYSLVMENALAALEAKNVGWTMFKGVFKPGIMEHDTILQRALAKLESKV